MKINKILGCLCLAYLLVSCNNGSTTKADVDTLKIDQHPAWIMQGNIYEVNVRQYTPEGTFKAFEKSLNRLKEMGVQTLWFMPINPISKVDRKGVLGSYYAVSSYVEINPEYGTMNDWKDLVKKCHEMGFKVIIDWVANHTGADHSWLTTHTDFYELDSTTKKPISPFDWTDARKLNFDNMALQDSMIEQMKFWIKETNIDGFRCDVAGEVRDQFWQKCITALKKEKNIFMLAEGDRKGLHESGFDASYAWNNFSVLKQIANGSRTIASFDSVVNKGDTLYPSNAIRMYFTSNHDENTWNKADYATMPGASHAPFAVLTQTMKNSIPLIYSGQEEPFLDSLSFFYKDTITFSKYERGNFYKKLLKLRNNNKALSANATFKKVSAGNDKFVYAFVREKDNKKVLVILNLSAVAQNIQIKDAALLGKINNLFLDKTEEVKNTAWQMEPWGYAVYEY